MTDFYGTYAGFKAYHDARLNGYTDNQAAIEAALLRASEYVDYRYSTRFPGEKTGARDQDREWPRISNVISIVQDIYYNEISSTVIPSEIENATYEIALREQVTPGVMHPDVRRSDRRKAVSVSGAVSVTYADANSVESYRLIVTIVDGILHPILTQNNGSSLSGKGYRI